MKACKVWACKIVVPFSHHPDGFDSPPRMAACQAIEKAGIPILACFSGWDGEIDEIERKIIEQKGGKK